MSAQPIPPSWKDLGKAGKDLLDKDFPKHIQLEVKTKAPNDVSFKVAGTKNTDTNAINGDLEIKYLEPKKQYGITQSWSTANALKTTLELNPISVRGLKLELGTVLLPAAGARAAGANGNIVATLKRAGVSSRTTLDVKDGRPMFSADAVVGRGNFLVGAEAAYDVNNATIKNYNAAVGYSESVYSVTAHALNKLSVFSAGYFHRVNRDVEAAAMAKWDSKATTSAVDLEIGVKHYLDNSGCVKAKINNNGYLQLGFTQVVQPGIKTHWGLAIDTQKINQPADSEKFVGAAHKLGASFVFES